MNTALADGALVAVQPGGVRLVVQPRPAEVRGRGTIEQLFLGGVAVEPRHGAQPTVARARRGLPDLGRSTPADLSGRHR